MVMMLKFIKCNWIHKFICLNEKLAREEKELANVVKLLYKEPKVMA